MPDDGALPQPPWSPNSLEAHACEELLKRVKEVSRQITERVRQATQETSPETPAFRTEDTAEGPAFS